MPIGRKNNRAERHQEARTGILQPPTGPYAWNSVGNAERLLDDGGRETLLYVPKQLFPWHVWDGNCWPEDHSLQVEKRMERILKAEWGEVWLKDQPRAVQTDEAKFLLGSGDKITLALNAAARHVAVESKVFDTHIWYLPCNNRRTYDMETGTVIASLPEHRMTRCVDVPALDGPVAHPVWDGVLDLVMGGDAEMIRYLRWVLGLCATGYVGEKSFWFWQGNTDAGKTTVLTFMARLLGPFVYAIPLRALLKNRQETGILHDIAGLQGMRLAYAEEFKPGDVLDLGWVKKISGGGDITADRKGEPDVTFPSTAKLIIGTNEMPAITDIDDALRGRVRVVPFPTNIPQVMRLAGKKLSSVDEVVEDLMVEAPAILYDLVLAVGEWRAAGKRLGMPESVKDASVRYLEDQDRWGDITEKLFVFSGDENDGVKKEEAWVVAREIRLHELGDISRLPDHDHQRDIFNNSLQHRGAVETKSMTRWKNARSWKRVRWSETARKEYHSLITPPDWS